MIDLRYNVITESAAMKIIYLRIAELNEKWSHRVIKGYFKCKVRSETCSGRGILNLTHNSGHYA